MKMETNYANIDKEVLDIMKEEDILKAVEDERQMKRLELNCFCELLSQVKGLKNDFDEFNQMISVCSADKMTSFFKELQKNVFAEEKRIELQEKIKKSHKKPKKKEK